MTKLPSDIPVQSYTRYELERLLYDPTLDIKDARAMALATPMDKKQFERLVEEVIEKNKLREDLVYKKKVIPAFFVRLLTTHYCQG